jgi:protein involved in temperature-dependent protein secretion
MGYVDSGDHVKDGRWATSGYMFTIDGRAISWSSKRQDLVTLSTMESEYIAQSHAAKEAIWLSALRAELFNVSRRPLMLLGDNQGAIALANDHRFHARTKHIDIRYHFIREHIEVGDLKLEYINTADNAADMFTKALPSATFKHLAAKIGLHDTSA